MATGKTTIGRQLASILNYTFQDTDQLVEQRAGAEIDWIFDMEGEEGFRDREQAVIDQATRQDNVVLATGGGAVLREANRKALRERGVVIYLKASPEVVVERTRRDRRRPLLRVQDVRARVEELTRERDPLYAAVAHAQVRTDHRPVKQIAADVADLLRNRHAPGANAR